MGESVDSDGPVEDILPRVGLESGGGTFLESEGVRGSALRWRETVTGEEVEKCGWADVEASEVG